MAEESVAVRLPVSVYNDLLKLAKEQEVNAVDLLRTLLEFERQRLELQRNWNELERQVRKNHSPETETTDELVARIREQREEIFNAEYAHLYR